MVLEIHEKDSMFTVKWQVNSQGFSTTQPTINSKAQ
jgi:hypothetical protein